MATATGRDDMAVDPTKADYDKDNVFGSATDIELSKRDTNKDGRISPKEEKAYANRAAKPIVSTTTARYDPITGKLVSSKTRTPQAEAEKPQGKSAFDYGVSGTFLQKYPEMIDFLKKAIAQNYDQARFNAEIEKTQFGIDRTEAEAAFDIAIEGPNSEDLNKQIQDRVSQLRQEFVAAGIQVSEQQLQEYGRNVLRSQLSGQDVLGLISSQFTLPSAVPGGSKVTGTSAQIYAELTKMARQYGLTMTDATLQGKVRQALQQGGGWQSWVEGQRELFKEQAKIQYPTISDKLDKYTLEDLVDPYLNDAADVLSLNKQNLSALDPMWSSALNGPNGPMSRDEWIRTLKTDARFGWDRTTKARQEYAMLGDELMSVFGMA
jgi:hypothetical protein